MNARPGLRLAAVTAAAMVLAGCSTFRSEGPASPRDLVRDAPERYSGAQAASAAVSTAGTLGEGWLRDFGDPQLEAIVLEVWKNNNALLSALARRDQAAAKAQLDKSQLFPRLDAQSQIGRQRQINDFLGGVPVVPDEAYISRIRVGLGVNWELDLWGRAYNAKEASVGEVWAADQDVQAARFSLAAQAANLWFNLIAAEQRSALSTQLVDSLAQALNAGEARQKAGLMSSAELRQIRADHVAAQAQALTHRLDRGRAARALEVLMGRYPGNALQAGPALPALPAPLSAGVPSELLARRPDVQSAALRVIASDQRLLSAKKNLLPHFTIQASGAFQSAYRDTLFTDDAFVWSIGGGLLQPLFDGGQIRAGIRAQRAALFESIYRYRDKVYGAFREVEDGLQADQELREQRGLLQQSVELAQENEIAAKESYDHGSLDVRIWLSAQRGTVQTQLSQLDLDLLLLNNRVALALALGGRPVAQPTPPNPMASAAPSDIEPKPLPATAVASMESPKPVAEIAATDNAAAAPSSVSQTATALYAVETVAAEQNALPAMPAAPGPAAAVAPIPAAAAEAAAGEASVGPLPAAQQAIQAAAVDEPEPHAADTRRAKGRRAHAEPQPTRPSATPTRAADPGPASDALTTPGLGAAPPSTGGSSQEEVAAAVRSLAAPAVPRLKELPAAYRSEFPTLRFDIHVYDEDPARRFVQLGEKRFREGDTLSQGPKIVAITGDGVVFDYRGQRTLYPLSR